MSCVWQSCREASQVESSKLRRSEGRRNRLAAIVESSGDAIITSWNIGAEQPYD